MSRRWKPPKDSQAEAESQRRKELQRKLADIVEYGTEEDFVAALKAYKPDASGEYLREMIMRFRAAVREKRGL
jgi:hypothetical protein